MTESRKSSPIIGDGGVSRFPLWREPDCVNGVDQVLVSTRHDPGASIDYRQLVAGVHRHGDIGVGFLGAVDSSEEHTSELQSPMLTSYAVLCLKKKNTLN